MITISARELDFKALNERIREARDPAEPVQINDCYGLRYIGSGLQNRMITINGIPGNALGAYLDGAVIEVNGNAQDAVGDTMNAGRIIIHGHAGDALGYAMRGGSIFVRDDAGYRTGIHMKEYKDRKPVIVVGGRVGSFLGEYLAGGLIVVLGLGSGNSTLPVGNFTGTGMHGGRIFIRTNTALPYLPAQVIADIATPDDLAAVSDIIDDFSVCFGFDAASIKKDRFYVLRPNAKNPYKQMYTPN